MLEEALWSVKQQTRAPDTVIVEIDSQRSGAAATRNRILEQCDTDLIAWLDDDDLIMGNHVERLAKVFEASPGFDLVYPIPRIVGAPDPTATSVNGQWVLPWKVPFGPEQRDHLIQRGSFIPMTHMTRVSKLREVGGFPQPGTEEWPRPDTEDWGMLIRLLNAGAVFYHLPVVTWIWNTDPGRGATGGQPNR